MSVVVPTRVRLPRVHRSGVVGTAGVMLTLLVVWEIGVRVSGTSSTVLPAPSAIAAEARWSDVLASGLVTTRSTLAGFVVGNLVGLALGLAIAASRTMSSLIFPGAIAVRSIPIVALAPFITLAVGRGATATIAVSALIVFFPTLVNVILGLRSVPCESLELMHVSNAPKIFTYVHVRLPYAGPAFFGALKIAAPAAVLGVMTAEWVLGGEGLGQFVIQSWLTLEVTTVWGAVAFSAVVAWGLFAVISLGERLLLGWAVRT